MMSDGDEVDILQVGPLHKTTSNYRSVYSYISN